MSAMFHHGLQASFSKEGPEVAKGVWECSAAGNGLDMALKKYSRWSLPPLLLFTALTSFGYALCDDCKWTM